MRIFNLVPCILSGGLLLLGCTDKSEEDTSAGSEESGGAGGGDESAEEEGGDDSSEEGGGDESAEEGGAEESGGDESAEEGGAEESGGDESAEDGGDESGEDSGTTAGGAEEGGDESGEDDGGTDTGDTGSGSGSVCTEADLSFAVEVRDSTGPCTTCSASDRISLVGIVENPCSDDVDLATMTEYLTTGGSATGPTGMGMGWSGGSSGGGPFAWTVPAGASVEEATVLGFLDVGPWSASLTFGDSLYAADCSL
jgi:hypothetical protein